ncbi:uncharacterized protein LOC113305526 [Papaver somniferum]|uniref:uncharacterized protein LOC113305526 n=1 Tax=Papaver somniferum TaxID=3469 RepID=UPI000E6FECD6|nr:uncharacterized protein LOC113305526 [Papaver somniferum]
MGTTLLMSSTYHPQTDGKTERVNACLKSYLRCMTSYRPTKLKRQAMGVILKSTLEEAQNRIKQQADKNRTEREFQVGEWVYLRLQPYRQTSVQLRRSLKLSAKFFGLYQFTARMGKVAYKIYLPFTSKIHPVFHVSQLKPKLGEVLLPQTTLPSLDSNGYMKVTPLQVLSTRNVKKHQELLEQVLVQWAHSTAADATWEDKASIRKQFPKMILEEKNHIE